MAYLPDWVFGTQQTCRPETLLHDAKYRLMKILQQSNTQYRSQKPGAIHSDISPKIAYLVAKSMLVDKEAIPA